MIEKRLVLVARTAAPLPATDAGRECWRVEVVGLDSCSDPDVFGPRLAAAAVEGIDRETGGARTVTIVRDQTVVRR